MLHRLYQAIVPARLRGSLMPKRLRRRVERQRHAVWQQQVLERLAQFPNESGAPRHSLPGPLVVSLTSYPRRFGMLHLTLRSLLDQSVRADTVVLWIADQDMEQLPAEVLRLRDHGLTIKETSDLRSFKKIVPALRTYPDAFILIADDDVYYEPDWLERMISAYDMADPTIVCTRAHRIRYDAANNLAAYDSWQADVQDARSEQPSRDMMPTGCGGVLYPPGSLGPIAADEQLIRKLSPTCDDSWLFFMWHLNGWSIRRVPGKPFRILAWPSTQDEALKHVHKDGSKDRHLADLSQYFGVPRV